MSKNLLKISEKSLTFLKKNLYEIIRNIFENFESIIEIILEIFEKNNSKIFEKSLKIFEKIFEKSLQRSLKKSLKKLLENLQNFFWNDLCKTLSNNLQKSLNFIPLKFFFWPSPPFSQVNFKTIYPAIIWMGRLYCLQVSRRFWLHWRRLELHYWKAGCYKKLDTKVVCQSQKSY